jgi:hypothetical protein
MDGLPFFFQTIFIDRSAYRNLLVYTRVELDSLTGVSKKNASIYLQKSICLMDRKIEWTEKQFLAAQSTPVYPFKSTASGFNSEKPSLILTPKHSGLGVMGMTEILTSLSLLNGIVDNTGKNPAAITLVETFEQAFSFSFNDIYDRQSDLFRRKPCNLTKTLDAMKAALTKEYRKRKSTGNEKTK